MNANAQCKICGKMFHAKPSHLKRGWGNYCSRKCVSANPLIKEKRALSCRTFFASEQELRQLYEKEKHTMKEIGAIFNSSNVVVRYWLKKNGVAIRTNSESHLGHIPWNKGKPWSQDVKNKIGRANSGRPKIHSMATRQKLSIAYKKLWANPERALKRFQSFNKRPNKPELTLIQIAEDYKLPLAYIGDGKRVIGGLFPDFIEKSDNPKKIVELFGDYWHDPKRRRLEYYQTEYGRKEIFARHGYDTLIIYERELFNPEGVSEKIATFLGV